MSSAHRFPPVVLAAALAAAFPASAAKINVNDTVRDAINKDKNALGAVLRAIGVTDGTWRLKSVKISGLKPGAKTLQMPASNYEFVTSKEIVNCAPTPTSFTDTLSEEVTNSVTLTKSDTLEVGAEVSVSAEYMGVSASLTGRTNYSMSNERADTTSRTQNVTGAVEVGFNEVGGRISTLEAEKLQATSIPWIATFTPDDDEEVEFVAGPRSDGSACFFQHKNYGGAQKCLSGDLAYVGDDFNDKISSVRIDGAAKVTLYQHRDYAGKEHGMTTSDYLLGGGWNDITSSIKVEPLRKSGSVKFGAVRAALPEAARVFTVRGSMSVAQTKFEKKRVINYEMRASDVARICRNTPVTSSAAAPAGAGTMRAGLKPTNAGLRVKTLSREEFRRAVANARPTGK